MNGQTPVVPVVAPTPEPCDLSTHEGIAKELLVLLTQANLQIPMNRVKDMKEILDWLEAIREGQLTIMEPTKQ